MKKLALGILALASLVGCGATTSVVATSNSQKLTALSAPNGVSLDANSPYIPLALDVRIKYFQQADQDQSGTLNASEFATTIMIGSLEDFDANRDGQVTLSEFNSKQQIEETATNIHMHVAYAFPKLDTNGDRKLSKAEMDRCSVSIEKMDGNQDGAVTMKEFETYDVAKERQILETATDYFMVPRKPYVI